jgi:Uma2 family endonuclease
MTAPGPHLWTGEEYDSLPVDNVRRELIDGVLVVSPSPTNPHQRLAFRLCTALDRGAPQDLYRVTQGVEVKLADRVRFIPDVLVVMADSDRIRGSQFLAHDVLIAVEIESPSSRSMDRVVKPSRLAAAGVPYYWRIQMGGTPTLFVHENTGNTYRVMGTFTDKVELDVPFPVAFDLCELAD